jgi:hypothetical protein
MNRKVSDECPDRAEACRQKEKHMNPSDRIAASLATTDSKPSRAPKRVQTDRPTGLVKKAKHDVSAKKAAPPERGTKTAKILALLKRPGGVLLFAVFIHKNTWQSFAPEAARMKPIGWRGGQRTTD